MIYLFIYLFTITHHTSAHFLYHVQHALFCVPLVMRVLTRQRQGLCVAY